MVGVTGDESNVAVRERHLISSVAEEVRWE